MMGNKKLQVWLPLLFSLVLIVGMLFGYKLGGGKNFFKSNRQTPLQEALDLIRLRYVDKVNTDSLQNGAIQQMMGQLDPHSVYFPPVELKEANEDLAGNFDGIGVEFNVFSDTVNIMYVLPGGPSERAGLLIGDKILAVNDSSLTGPTVTSARIKEAIRGERGSSATLTIMRGTEIKKISVARGSIPVPAIYAAYMITPTTGYIKLNKFTQNSYEEFMQAMEQLLKQGMKELIYDLRGNGGGFMSEAFDMADEFLSDNKLVVYTEGANSRKEEYRCKRPGLFEQGKLIVLIDELSASASEVLAGALQDWDRATIIGRRSFGKGLVQLQFGLSDGSAIRLTTARYYTPLGRSIQRPYDKGKKVYMDEIWERYSNGEVLYADSNKVNNGKKFTTPGGHVVYGGGGIMPDIFVPIDTSFFPTAVNRLLVQGKFNSFVYRYYLQHRKEIDQYKSVSNFSDSFNKVGLIWDTFVKEASSDSVDLRSVTARQRESLQLQLEAYLARFRWRNNGYYQIINAEDSMILKALEALK